MKPGFTPDLVAEHYRALGLPVPAEIRALLDQGGSESKYRNERIDGYASKLEAREVGKLPLLAAHGRIRDLVLQPRFLLQEAFEKNGERFQAVEYVADASYFDLDDDQQKVIDAKGFRNAVYKLKRKLFEYRYPALTITEWERQK